MSNKHIKDVLNLTEEELVSKIRDAQSTLFKLKVEHSTGQLGNTSSVWKERKNLARMRMVLAQKAKPAEKAAKPAAAAAAKKKPAAKQTAAKA